MTGFPAKTKFTPHQARAATNSTIMAIWNFFVDGVSKNSPCWAARLARCRHV